jgi:hypothetical protein
MRDTTAFPGTYTEIDAEAALNQRFAPMAIGDVMVTSDVDCQHSHAFRGRSKNLPAMGAVNA